MKAAAMRAAARKAAGPAPRPRIPSFSLFDPLRYSHRRRRRTVPEHELPRIIRPDPLAPRLPPPSPDDRIDATRIRLRIAALAAALDDLPGQALRYARWQARVHAFLRHSTRLRRRRWLRTSPLRPGPPRCCRLKRWDPAAKLGVRIREIDEILAHAHELALYALQYPDTS